jgi:predicted DNA-binding transcriptional regulator YafY
MLAERGSASAKDAAGELGISLRSAQAALAELAQSGACDAQKDGRNVAYVVEDTVFSEPSRRLTTSELTGLTALRVN